MESLRRIGKRAIFFTIDAFIASGILFVGLLIISSFHINDQPTVHLSYLSDDITGVFSELKVNEINDPYISSLISDGNITHLNNSVMEQIGEFWAEDNNEIAKNFTQAVLNGIIPDKYGYSVLVDDEEILNNSGSFNNSLISSRKIASGYAKLKPVLGYTSKIFLTSIKNRKTSSFSYFGGFEGQGNLTKKILLAANITSIEEVYLEVDSANSFDFYINGNYVGNFVSGSSGGGYMIPDKWAINESYHSYFNEGYNNFSVKFTSGTIDEHYIAGGFLRVTYVTPDTDELGVTYNPDGSATKKFWFPEIDGLTNLYSSFDVPGTLQSMSLHLHILSNASTYITIGNRLMVLSEGSSSEQYINIPNSNFTSPPDPLDYMKMSNSTVPLRLASYETSAENVTSGDLDLIILTDMSGSMKKAVSDNSLGNLGANCNEVYTDPTVRRTQLAKCLDKEMIGGVMNYSGVRVWLVELYDTDDISNWTRSTAGELYDVIDTDFNANGKGKTCLACAVNEAYNIFSSYSSPERTKAFVMMTDGIPTHTANGIVADQEVCVGYCDTTGACGPGDIEGCDDDNCAAAVNDTQEALKALNDDFDAVIYGVGFGPISQCSVGNDTLKDMVEYANGTFYSSDDPAALLQIYENITDEVVTIMDQSNQTVNVIGSLYDSMLYGDSYIELNYTPIVDAPVYGEIPVTVYGNEFGNSISEGTIFIPDDATLVELQVTSYSDELWTDNVSVDNSINLSNAFGLYQSSLNYTKLGDPFIIQIPPDMVTSDVNNTVTVKTASAAGNSSGGSSADRLIYTVRIDSLLDYGEVFYDSVGCEWHVDFEDGTNDTIKIPSGYSGSENCYYANATYDTTDALNDATYRLFSKLDFDGDGELEVSLDENNIEIDTLTVSDVPSLWGPAIVEVRIW
jgi:hypothetical protein